LIVELCADQPETAQRSGAGAKFGHACGRQDQIRSYDNLLHLSPSGEEHSDRTPHVLRKLAHRFGQLGGEHFIVRHAAPVQSLDGAELAGS
jgi:hypothetical protein